MCAAPAFAGDEAARFFIFLQPLIELRVLQALCTRNTKRREG
jgi:hypothetical protein